MEGVPSVSAFITVSNFSAKGKDRSLRLAVFMLMSRMCQGTHGLKKKKKKYEMVFFNKKKKNTYNC